MENLLFCLNATAPIFFTILLGCFFRNVGLMDGDFVKKMNRFVFKVALPVLLFEDLWTADIESLWDGKFVTFCAAFTVATALLSILLAYTLKNKEIRGEFAQAAFRSNIAILGVSFVQNIYGEAGLASIMMVASVPFNNIFAVLILSLMKKEQQKLDRNSIRKIMKDIFTNPIIVGILMGILFSVCKVPQVSCITKTLNNLGVLASPLGLMAIGASFEGKKALAMVGPTLYSSFLRLIGYTAIGLLTAVCLGFRGQALVAILVLAGSSTAVSSFIMAKNMGHDGILTSSVIMVTTIGSAFTMTAWLYVLRMLEFV